MSLFGAATTEALIAKCSAKLKMNSSGTIFDVKGKHADSCYAKAEAGKLERVIGFRNPALFRCFGGNQKVFIDGTFKIVPKPFY